MTHTNEISILHLSIRNFSNNFDELKLLLEILDYVLLLQI